MNLSETEFDELRSQLTGYPVLRPSWGILDLLTASGDLLLLEDARLRTKLANLKPDGNVYVDNQEVVIQVLTSEVVTHETGNLILPFKLPNAAIAEDPGSTRLQLDRTLKVRQFPMLMYEYLLKNQGQVVLKDLEEIAALLP